MRQLSVPADFLVTHLRGQLGAMATELAAERVAVAYLTELLAAARAELAAAQGDLVAQAAQDGPGRPSPPWRPDLATDGAQPACVDPGAVQRPILGGSRDPAPA